MERYEMAGLVRKFISDDPQSMSLIIEAATRGMNDALAVANTRAGELDGAWRMALVLLTADRILPGMKASMARTLLPVLERTTNVACSAEKDAKTMIDAMQ